MCCGGLPSRGTAFCIVRQASLTWLACCPTCLAPLSSHGHESGVEWRPCTGAAVHCACWPPPFRYHTHTHHAMAMRPGSSGAPAQALLSTVLSSHILMPAPCRDASMRCSVSCSGIQGTGPNAHNWGEGRVGSFEKMSRKAVLWWRAPEQTRERSSRDNSGVLLFSFSFSAAAAAAAAAHLPGGPLPALGGQDGAAVAEPRPRRRAAIVKHTPAAGSQGRLNRR